MSLTHSTKTADGPRTIHELAELRRENRGTHPYLEASPATLRGHCSPSRRISILNVVARCVLYGLISGPFVAGGIMLHRSMSEDQELMNLRVYQLRDGQMIPVSTKEEVAHLQTRTLVMQLVGLLQKITEQAPPGTVRMDDQIIAEIDGAISGVRRATVALPPTARLVLHASEVEEAMADIEKILRDGNNAEEKLQSLRSAAQSLMNALEP